jgi:hypothetical protein
MWPKNWRCFLIKDGHRAVDACSRERLGPGCRPRNRRYCTRSRGAKDSRGPVRGFSIIMLGAVRVSDFCRLEETRFHLPDRMCRHGHELRAGYWRKHPFDVSRVSSCSL